MTAMLTLFDPTAPFDLHGNTAESGAFQPVFPGMASLVGKVVGFIENTKPNIDKLAAIMGRQLREQHGVARILNHQKRNASVPADEAVLSDFARQCDLVIAGSGD